VDDAVFIQQRKEENMNARTIKSAASGLLLLGTLVVAQGTPASAAPVSSGSGTVNTAADGDRGGGGGGGGRGGDRGGNRRDYERGYKDGYSAGWTQAKRDCRWRWNDGDDHGRGDRHGQYSFGYKVGYKQGYSSSYRHFCRHHR